MHMQMQRGGGGGARGMILTIVLLLLLAIQHAGSSRNFNGVHVGLQQRDGSTSKAVGQAEEVESIEWMDELPEKLRQRKGALCRFLMTTGQCPYQHVCEVYLLGTAHVSRESCEDVNILMDYVQPDVLFMELCDLRLSMLEEAIPEMSDQNAEKGVGQTSKEIMALNPGMNKAAALSTALFSKIQADFAKSLNVTLGGEFREALRCARTQQARHLSLLQEIRSAQLRGEAVDGTVYQKAQKSKMCAVVLGDRPVKLTLLRLWEALSFFEKVKLVVGLAWSSIRQPSTEELKEWIESIMNDPSRSDILSKCLEDVGRQFPAITRTVIHERDIYMSCKILQAVRILEAESAQKMGASTPRKIVAIVGAGHCPGISSILKAEIDQPGSLNVEKELRQVVHSKKQPFEGDAGESLIRDIMLLESA